MPFVQHARKELRLKIVYYGPGLGGKTTNLEYIHRHSREAQRGKLISLTTESERTLFFDLLPMELGEYQGYTLRLHLCTVPGQIAQDRTRRLVLRHVDGVVFVVDSQPTRLDENIESMRNLEANLALQGDDPARIPWVVQYNKQDLPGVMDAASLQTLLELPEDVMQIKAAARQGDGVFETLKAITRACLELLGPPAQAAEGRSPSILPGRRVSMLPEATPGALRAGALRAGGEQGMSGPTRAGQTRAGQTVAVQTVAGHTGKLGE